MQSVISPAAVRTVSSTATTFDSISTGTSTTSTKVGAPFPFHDVPTVSGAVRK